MAQLYSSLPTYGSKEFWRRVEEWREECLALPLEVLVKVLRADALARDDRSAQRRLFAVIVARVQEANERWVERVLCRMSLLSGERRAVAADLYADLCEQLLRSLLDEEQSFWEEHFYHSLRFARGRVHENFLRREGRWYKTTPGPGERVPYTLVESLERAEQRPGMEHLHEVADARAEQAFLQVEQADSVALLLRLPARQRAIVWLIFWEDCSTKTVGELLGISERTVRNRLRAALTRLRQIFVEEQEEIDGASA
jgi:RNA polymerase sigma factor (sigma-70 family)